MADKIEHFLIVFDHRKAEMLELVEFGTDSDRAVEAYSAKEREYGRREFIDIVLIGSDSLDTVKITHANYFDGTVAVSKYFAGILR